MELKITDLENTIAKPPTKPTGVRLSVSAPPAQYVAPPVEVIRSDNRKIATGVEVLFIEAPAAVGKSTVAHHISAERGVPVLNLAKLRVSTGTLAGLITSEFADAAAAQAAFHAGQLPVLIDALDEGRMFSGEHHIEEFLQSTFEFVLQSRTVTEKPKLIFLSRPEARKLAEVALELFGAGIKSAHLEIGYFDEAAARELIDQNARVVAKPGSAYLTNQAAVKEVVDAYFTAIESALGIAEGELWSDRAGRAFAGYAPVLGALGHLLANIANFSKVTTKLRSTGTQEA